jgi:Skp family chaperone for outer membrane proteins
MTISLPGKAISWFIVLAVSMLTPAAFAASSSAEKTSMEEVQQQMKEAATAIKNYSVEQRDEAGREVKATLNELDADIEHLQQRLDKKAGHMDKAARQKARAALEDIRKQRNDLSEWYGGMQHSTSEAWQEIKSGFLESFEILQQSIDKAQEEF